MNLNEFAPWQCPLCGAPLAGDVYMNAHGGATAPIEDHSDEV